MNTEIRPIAEIAGKLKIPEEMLIPYGPEVAKLKLDLLADWETCRKGRLIMVTAVTPTAHGEGKTVVSIGLTQAMAQLKKRVVTTLREPSLGPVFGLKGGATGGGRSQVLPAGKINLHFTGDFHAITSAHNLLAAALDSHIFHGHEPRFDINSVTWPRAMDMNDRALRNIIVGLGGKSNGLPRESGFVITAASEIMAILGMAESRRDLRRRLEAIVPGYDAKGQPIRAGQLGVTGALMVLLNEALMPNLAQTTEHVPAIVHTGPFANIACGTSSVISQRMALKLADYVVNESGFGADLGAEKYFDIVMAASRVKPAAAVLIATARALTAHGAPRWRLRCNTCCSFMARNPCGRTCRPTKSPPRWARTWPIPKRSRRLAKWCAAMNCSPASQRAASLYAAAPSMSQMVLTSTPRNNWAAII